MISSFRISNFTIRCLRFLSHSDTCKCTEREREIHTHIRSHKNRKTKLLVNFPLFKAKDEWIQGNLDNKQDVQTVWTVRANDIETERWNERVCVCVCRIVWTEIHKSDKCSLCNVSVCFVAVCCCCYFFCFFFFVWGLCYCEIAVLSVCVCMYACAVNWSLKLWEFSLCLFCFVVFFCFHRNAHRKLPNKIKTRHEIDMK